MKARDLWERSATPPGLGRSGHPVSHHHQRLHTCPESGPIRASNPCSEYMFLDDTACNLASLNLIQFRDSVSKAFDVKGYEHAIPVDADARNLVAMAQFPSKRSRACRTITAPSASLRQYRRPPHVVGHPL